MNMPSSIATVPSAFASPLEPQPILLRGDANADGLLELSDGLAVLNFLFTQVVDSLPCKDAADIDNDGTINIADPINLLNHLFGPQPPPAPPGAVECGPDPDAPGSPGDLGCEQYTSC